MGFDRLEELDQIWHISFANRELSHRRFRFTDTPCLSTDIRARNDLKRRFYFRKSDFIEFRNYKNGKTRFYTMMPNSSDSDSEEEVERKIEF